MANGQIQAGLKERLSKCGHSKDCESHEFLILYIDLTNTKLDDIQATQREQGQEIREIKRKLYDLTDLMEKDQIIEEHEEKIEEKQLKKDTYTLQTETTNFHKYWTKIGGVTGICSIIITFLVFIFGIATYYKIF